MCEHSRTSGSLLVPKVATICAIRPWCRRLGCQIVPFVISTLKATLDLLISSRIDGTYLVAVGSNPRNKADSFLALPLWRNSFRRMVSSTRMGIEVLERDRKSVV